MELRVDTWPVEERLEDVHFGLHRGLGFRVSGLGFRVSGLGFRVSDLGFRV